MLEHADVKKVNQDTSFAPEPYSVTENRCSIDDWKLDKSQTAHHDILDSFRLSLCNMNFQSAILDNSSF